MKADLYMLDLDDRIYLIRPAERRIESLTPEARYGPAPRQLGDVITDYGSLPQMKEVYGRPRYIESLLAKELRDTGEAIAGSAIILDHQHRLDERASMVLYQVMERSEYKRYANLVEGSAEPCLLHSLGRLYVAAGREHGKTCTLMLFAHHETIDLVAVENGSVVGYRRLPGMFAEGFRTDRLTYLVDQVNSLQQQLPGSIEQIAVYQLLVPAQGPLNDWPVMVSERLNLPMRETHTVTYEFLEGENSKPCSSQILPLVDRLTFLNSSAPLKNRLLAATVALIPVVALVLLLINAAMFSVYALTTVGSRALAVEIAEVETEIAQIATGDALSLPTSYQNYFQTLQYIEQLRRLPTYEEILAELGTVLADDVPVSLDGVRLVYPGDSSYRSLATSQTGALATASGEGVLIEVIGRLDGDALAVMQAFDRISRRIGGIGFRLLDSTINNGPGSSDFALRLERRINEN
jgi:hypothetical protein